MNLHDFLDFHYGADGDQVLRRRLQHGDDPNERRGALDEIALHVATRRRRLEAVSILLDHGAEIDARNAAGKTAYAHAVRRSFDEVAELLTARGAGRRLSDADRLAVALAGGRLDEALALLAADPGLARTGNSEEDRLLADLAGRGSSEPVALLIAAGADLEATALDDGTTLHQAAWFGQPRNARLLIDAGAPLERFDATHHSSPLGWAVHGSRYSGGAAERQDVYLAIVRMLLDAGAELHAPGTPEKDDYYRRLLADASPRVAELLREGRAQ